MSLSSSPASSNCSSSWDNKWCPFSTTPLFGSNDSISSSPSSSSITSFQYSNTSSASMRPLTKSLRHDPESSNIQPSSSPTNINSVSSASNIKYPLPKRSQQVDINDFLQRSQQQRVKTSRVTICSFCKSNNEPEYIYTSHSLKDYRDKITCPILIKYTCPFCNASGENSHTKKYCPVLQRKIRMNLIGDKI